MLKSLIKKTRLGKSYLERLASLQAERDYLAAQVEILSRQTKPRDQPGEPQNAPLEGWSMPKERKRKMSEANRAAAATSILIPKIPQRDDHLSSSVKAMVEYQVKAEPYWFQNIEVLPGLNSAGWSNPSTDKLPYYGLPDDLTGMRVLDIG
jgi:hypothetical protein